jgi:hypothetical protein
MKCCKGGGDGKINTREEEKRKEGKKRYKVMSCHIGAKLF